jgi:geranylgeranyl diphosphate/geranylgeranyl-bacteriochlorophyllide a reductase
MLQAPYDIAILGAGPAGSTLARLLARRYRVLLVDRRRLDAAPGPGQFVKSCGGLVSPDAQKAMAQFRLGIPTSVLVGPQLFTVRTIDLPTGLERYYQRHYINVDRERMDRWLASLAVGADTRFGCLCTGIDREPAGDGFTLHLSPCAPSGAPAFTERARLVVGADGAGSSVRRLAAPTAPSPKRYVAIQRWYAATDPQPFFSALFDPGITDFYAWTIPKEDRLLVGAAFAPGAGAHALFARLEASLAGYGYDLSRPLSREGSQLYRPVAANQVALGSNGLALVGEAAGFISPSSSEGFSYAFRSALALARALAPGLDGWEPRYRRETASLRTHLVLKHLKSPGMYWPALRHLALRSGFFSHGLHDD